LRTLIDRPSWGYVLLPLVAPHHRREGLVYWWPFYGASGSGPLSTAVEADYDNDDGL
jgi:hypothetical protein